MKVLVMAEPFGYGPVATAINVAKELKDKVDMDFVGSGIAIEQALMSGLFNNCINCDLNDNKELEKYLNKFKEYDAILSSDTLNGTIFMVNNSIDNIYYLDNLVWMWDKLPTEFINLKKYFISETIPCKENFKRIGKQIKNPVFVGPIRNIDVSNDEKIDEEQLIINIGGAESFLLDKKLINQFYNKIINNILESNGIEKFKKILICGGSCVISKLNINRSDLNIIATTLPYDEYIKEMRKTKYFIMASGLGNFIETIGKNKNIMYLPAINYSQLLQIEYYKQQNFGFDILNWDDFKFYEPIEKYLDEETGVKKVVSNIEQFLNDDYSLLIKQKTSKFLCDQQDDYYNTRKDYILKFNPNASKIISEYILNLD